MKLANRSDRNIAAGEHLEIVQIYKSVNATV